LQIRADATKGFQPSLNLQIKSGYVRWKEPGKVEFIAFNLGERSPFVQQGIIQQLVAAQCGLQDLWICSHGFSRQ
jgi:hypothetical protein